MKDDFYDGLPVTTDEEYKEYINRLLRDMMDEAYAQIRKNAKDGMYDCW